MKPADSVADGSTGNGREDLAELYGRYAAWLERALRRRFGPAVAAISADLVHDTYIRLEP